MLDAREVGKCTHHVSDSNFDVQEHDIGGMTCHAIGFYVINRQAIMASFRTGIYVKSCYKSVGGFGIVIKWPCCTERVNEKFLNNKLLFLHRKNISSQYN